MSNYYLKPIDYQLYQFIKVMCDVTGKVTAKRETLCCWLGLSQNSKDTITDSIRRLTGAGLVNVVYRPHPIHPKARLWDITLTKDSKKKFDQHIGYIIYENTEDGKEFIKEMEEEGSLKTPRIYTKDKDNIYSIDYRRFKTTMIGEIDIEDVKL